MGKPPFGPSRTAISVLLAATATVVGLVAVAHASAGSAVSAKQQFGAAEQQRITQAQGERAPTKPNPASVVVPQPTSCSSTVALPRGIAPLRQGPFGSASAFVASNEWSGTSGAAGTSYAVWAGATGAPSGSPGVPAVDVYLQQLTASGCGWVYAPVGVFTNQSASGLLTIDSVSDAKLHLTAPDGHRYLFDLDTFTFADQP